MYVETKENIVCCLITGLIRENDILKLIFSNELIEHVTNCINHVKMLPLFIKMGYHKKNFLADSSLNKCEVKYAQRIKRNFIFFGVYNKTAIDNYIGKYFAMKADISGKDYSKQLSILSGTDKELYEMLEKFWKKWIKFDIDTTDAIDYWLDDFAGELIESLEEWTLKRKIK